MHICWGLSSEPVAYESVPRNFLSELGSAELPILLLLHPTPPCDGRSASGKGCCCGCFLRSGQPMGGWRQLLPRGHEAPPGTHRQGPGVQYGTQAFCPLCPCSQLQLNTCSCSPIACCPLLALLQWVRAPGGARPSIEATPASHHLYVKLQILFLQQPGGAWPRQREPLLMNERALSYPFPQQEPLLSPVSVSPALLVCSTHLLDASPAFPTRP